MNISIICFKVIGVINPSLCVLIYEYYHFTLCPLSKPALECDEDIWDSKQIQSSLKDTHRSGKHICDDDKDGIESFYGFICDSLCYGPTKQRGPWFIHLPYTLISSLAGDDE